MESSYIEFGSARRPWLCAPCLWLAPIGLVAVLGAAAMHMHSSEERERTALAAVPTTRPEGVCAANSLPHKHSLSHVTPVELQMERGGCWMFAAVSMLEHSYRQQGVANGWLAPKQYLKLSQQAFGVAVLDACRQATYACVFDGDRIYTGNSTEGGEVPVLYYLKALSSTAALPWSTCPYTPSKGRDRECEGLSAAQRLSPLAFTVRGMRTYYERVDTKQALPISRRAPAELAPSSP